jgi:hypothetical protein
VAFAYLERCPYEKQKLHTMAKGKKGVKKIKIPREYLAKLRNALVGKSMWITCLIGSVLVLLTTRSINMILTRLLRRSDEMGRDKDVTKELSAFMAYKR